jgi:MFS family permease
VKRELAKLITGQIFLHACMTGMRLATPLLALQQGYSTLAVGVLLALFSLTQVFLAIPAGRFTDRHGLKLPVQIGVGMACLGAGLAVIWPIFPVLCIGALATGGATGITVIALQRHVGRISADANELKETFSWLAIGPAVSNFMGPFFAGLMIDYAGAMPADADGFRATFVMLTIFLYWLGYGFATLKKNQSSRNFQNMPMLAYGICCTSRSCGACCLSIGCCHLVGMCILLWCQSWDMREVSVPRWWAPFWAHSLWLRP